MSKLWKKMLVIANACNVFIGLFQTIAYLNMIYSDMLISKMYLDMI